MENLEEKACLCALNRIFGFRPEIGTALISHLGSGSEVFRLGRRSLEEMLGRDSRHLELISPDAVRDASRELKSLEVSGTRFIGWNDPAYPSLLKECPDAPVGLYIKSLTPPEELWNISGSIAVVGTRDISPYGREWCTRTVSALASTDKKPLIISGLALGTDICAHRAALEYGLPTIAVMATGPDSIYPFRHRDFADRLRKTEGCALVTDYPPGTAPLGLHFLRRNRIIAGLSEAVILIESKVKGGGMNTARLAFSYSRDVYALPGRADDIRSQGCNRLIREKIAEPLVSTEDLLESLGMRSAAGRRKASAAEILREHFNGRISPEDLSSMSSIIEAIRKERGITLEEISHTTGTDYSRTARIAGIMELEGLICIDLLQRCTLESKIFR